MYRNASLHHSEMNLLWGLFRKYTEDYQIFQHSLKKVTNCSEDDRKKSVGNADYCYVGMEWKFVRLVIRFLFLDENTCLNHHNRKRRNVRRWFRRVWPKICWKSSVFHAKSWTDDRKKSVGKLVDCITQRKCSMIFFDYAEEKCIIRMVIFSENTIQFDW
jgi:hypothetical protein